MRRSGISGVVRGVPLEVAKRRLAQIADIARRSQATDSLCAQWAPARFELVERAALALVESPPPNLSAVAMDELQALRVAFGDEMSRFSEVLEELYCKPDWRIAYLSYFVPFGLAVLDDLARVAQPCRSG